MQGGPVEAVFARRMTAVNERRLALLGDGNDGDPADPADADLRLLARALVEPLAAEVSDEPGGSWYVRFVAEVMRDPRTLAREHDDRPYLVGLRLSRSRRGSTAQSPRSGCGFSPVSWATQKIAPAGSARPAIVP